MSVWTDPTDKSSGPSRRRAMPPLRLLQARLSLVWETAWPAAWPAVGFAALFVGIALLDGFTYLPGWLHALFLGVFAALFCIAAWRGVRALVWPSRYDAVRRIETASGMEHRPLEALEDRLPDGVDSPAAKALWQAHQKQMAERARALKVGLPSPGLPARDPWALRAAVGLLVLVAVLISGPEAGERLERAFLPEIGGVARDQTAKLELWIAPPDYTRLPPIFPAQLARDHAASRPAAEDAGKDAGADGEPAEVLPELVIEVPAGSQLTAIVSGGRGKAFLDLNGAKTPFEALDPVNRRLQQVIDGDGRLSVMLNGETLGSWRIRTKPDDPPAIAFDKPPAPSERGALRLSYKGTDDYGIVEVRGEMRRTYERGEVIGKEVSVFDLAAPPPNARNITEASFLEIAPHPWAGLPVVLRLSAKDAAGQESFSEEVKIVLPERRFNNPVAKKIIAERRRLTTQPERRPEIVNNLGEIASNPRAFKDDKVVFMGLTFSRSRLIHEKAETAIAPVRDLLWDTALRVEDGQLSHAERELLRAQEALTRALAQNAPDAELERLMRELQTALNRYLRELAKKLENAPDSDQAMPLDPTTRLLQTSDLQRMLEQIRQMMRSGSRDAARQMLSQLRRMLENLRNARVMRANPNARQGNQAFRQLQEMIRRQNQLMDRTFRQSMGRNNGQNFQRQLQQGAGEQRSLREMLRKLQQMMRRFAPGDNPASRALGQAGRSMDDAARALDQRQPGNAVGPQGQALEALRRAGRGMVQQMMNRFARGNGVGLERQFNPMRGMRDPLGREWQDEDGTDTRRVKIPDRGAIERAQEILDELRKRAGQRHRPQIELDYINRLLQRF